MSKRDDARKAAHKLARKTGWSVDDFEAKSPIEKLQELDAKDRSKDTYEDSEACAECAKAREESGDETALCQEHLAAAMGF